MGSINSVVIYISLISLLLQEPILIRNAHSLALCLSGVASSPEHATVLRWIGPSLFVGIIFTLSRSTRGKLIFIIGPNLLIGLMPSCCLFANWPFVGVCVGMRRGTPTSLRTFHHASVSRKEIMWSLASAGKTCFIIPGPAFCNVVTWMAWFLKCNWQSSI